MVRHSVVIVLSLATIGAILAGIIWWNQQSEKTVTYRMRDMLSRYLPADCLQDSRLVKRVTLDASGLPVAEVLQLVSASSGIPLSPARDVGSLRVCVHVREMPLIELMASLAGVLELRWQPSEGGGYQLYQPAELREELHVQAQQRTQKALRTLRHAIAVVKAGRTDEPDHLMPATTNLRSSYILAVVSSLSATEMNRLVAGEPLWIPGERLPEEAKKPVLQEQGGTSERVFAELSVSPLSRAVSVMVYTDNGGLGTVIDLLPELSQPRPDRGTRDMEDYSLLFREGEPPPVEKVERFNRAEKLTVTEAIARIARQLGLNVVAEYYPLTMHRYVIATRDPRNLVARLSEPVLYSAQHVDHTLWLTAHCRAEHRHLDIPPETLERWFEGSHEFGLTMDIALEIARLPLVKQDALKNYAISRYSKDTKVRVKDKGLELYDTPPYSEPAKREVYTQLQDLTNLSINSKVASRNFTSPVVRLLARLPEARLKRVLDGEPLPLRALPPEFAPVLEELFYCQPSHLRNLWFRSKTPCWLEIQRTIGTMWATEAQGVLWKYTSPSSQTPDGNAVNYRVRVEKVRVRLRTPAETFEIPGWEWYRFKRV
ncbi:MAG: hypothetical protein HPY54_13390 [Chthonomonadetes bacterium]|nr:hypothetical protein [Chthonomonadetes bacterium]